jgi:hypothetical protein
MNHQWQQQKHSKLANKEGEQVQGRPPLINNSSSSFIDDYNSPSSLAQTMNEWMGMFNSDEEVFIFRQSVGEDEWMSEVTVTNI